MEVNVMNGGNFTRKIDYTIEADCCNSEYCRKCGGEYCCKVCGCAYSPMDFLVFRQEYSKEDRVKYLIWRIRKGDISFDHRRVKNQKTGAFVFTGDPRYRENVTVSKEKLLEGQGLLYLRARNRGKRICDIIHYNWETDGPCVNWSEESGCRYKLFGKKPRGGQRLIPGKTPMYCDAKYSEIDAALEWSNFQDVLYEVFRYFWEKGM